MPLPQVSTLIGYGSPNKADTHDVHGAPLGKDETAATRKNLQWPYGEFEVHPGCCYAGRMMMIDLWLPRLLRTSQQGCHQR